MFSLISRALMFYPTAVRNVSNITGDYICPGLVRGVDYLKDARLYKGLAFTNEERQTLGLNGILAYSVKTQEEQINIAMYSFDRYKDNLNKYLYMAELLDTNERLFYSLVDRDVQKFLPILYTPTVGLACQRFGVAYKKPKGLYINIKDKGRVFRILNNWPEQDIKAICVTDGERILGLGDLGAYGMGIPIGKMSLYTALAGVRPHQCLPITLDVGTNTKSLLEDPLYIGIRQKRATGEEYYEFVDEFMQSAVQKYGSTVLLQFEDFALHNATPLLNKYKDSYCTFNDDIQGTASVALAGLYAATKVTKKKMSEQVYLFLGAGSASTGIGHLIAAAMKEEGIEEKDAYGKIYMFDIDGLVTSRRKSGLPPAAAMFGKDMEPTTNFEQIVGDIKATVLIGCSTVGGAFSTAILKQMAKNCDRPVIFALSNPTIKAECTAQDAYDHTEGRCIFASGSPFPPVNYNGKKYVTGQGNNSYIFPGIVLGVICAATTVIPDSFFVTAAKTVSNIVTDVDLEQGSIFPPLTELKTVSIAIALEIIEEAYKLGIATVKPKPKNTLEFVCSKMYKLTYPSVKPPIYEYPQPDPPYKVKTIEEAYKAAQENDSKQSQGKSP